MNWAKKNIQTIILLVAALLVWVLVAGKYFGYSSVVQEQENPLPINFKQNKSEKEMYALNLDYDDPFLKRHKKSRKRVTKVVDTPNQINTTSQKNRKKMPVEESFTWPEITYKGMGSNKSKAETFAWIDFNGDMIILELNKVVKQFKVEAIYQDSLIISREGKHKTYIKN